MYSMRLIVHSSTRRCRFRHAFCLGADPKVYPSVVVAGRSTSAFVQPTACALVALCGFRSGVTVCASPCCNRAVRAYTVCADAIIDWLACLPSSLAIACFPLARWRLQMFNLHICACRPCCLCARRWIVA